MNPELLDILKAQGERLIAEGFINYERKNGGFSVSASKRRLQGIVLGIMFNVIDRITTGEPVSVSPIKQNLLEAFLEFDLNSELAFSVFSEVFDSVTSFVRSQPIDGSELIRTFEAYKFLISTSLGDINYFSKTTVLDIIQKPEAYQYSSNKYEFGLVDIDRNTKRVYTLFPKSRYWEEYSKLSDSTSYSPLYYNRVASSIGLSRYRIPLEYRDVIIKDGKIYKLSPEVPSANRRKFIASEWVEYNSRVFDVTKSFKKVFSEKIQNYYTGFLDNGFDVNEIVSDSKVSEYAPEEKVDLDQLSSTFGGKGRSIYQSIQQLKIISDYFGAHQGSVSGGVEYISKYSEYLFAAAFGRNAGKVFDVVSSQSTFGRFDLLFVSSMRENEIPGLKFINGFAKLRSFAHGQEVETLPPENKTSVFYNPTYSQFKNGIDDVYSSTLSYNTYNELPKVDLLLYSLESLYRKCLGVGDSVQAVLNSLDVSGRLKGYEGLGPIKPQMAELQRVFPPTRYINSLSEGTPAGITGGIQYLLNSYSSISKTLVYPQFPGQSLEFILQWTTLISNQMEAIISDITRLGIGTDSFIPNIQFKRYELSNQALISFLGTLGFRDTEIDQLLRVESISDLIVRFAPLTDSSDIKSFFKAYELTQLIYEFGGQPGIDAYLNFLYQKSEVDSLLNLLSIAQKDKNKATYIQINKYPKLVGLLIGLTYAIDPGQLVRFVEILGNNNLTLLESIEYLYESGQQNIIKSKEDIDLLSPLIDQLTQGIYPDVFGTLDANYEQTNSTVPIALKQWTELMGDNLGNIDSRESIRFLYDKSVGLTPKELVSILNSASAANPLGQMLDGFSGGAFTQFLRYANLTGLATKLGYYKNSSQLDNFEVDYATNSYTLPLLLEGLRDTADLMKIANFVFETNLDYNLEASSSGVMQSLVYAQNKELSATSDILTEISSSNPQLATLDRRVREAKISESPGVGNSRIPNRVPVINSITSEQFKVLFNRPGSTVQEVSRMTEISASLINNFIKFSDPNKLINTIDISDETKQFRTTRSTVKSYSPVTQYEDPAETVSAEKSGLELQKIVSSIPYSVSPVYQDLGPSKQLKSQALGANYISETVPDPGNIIEKLVKPFDRVSSCKKFGGSDCETLYPNPGELCSGPLNKSLAPATYSVPGAPKSSVSIDRPLGTFAEYKPSETIVPTSAFSDPPSYYGLLEPAISTVGERAEPILKYIFSTPLLPKTGGGDLSEFGNSEFGIAEFVKAKFERSTEFNCATFASPFEYQMCMNLMKCKRFSPPYGNKYYLPFCPKTLSGGRLR